MVQNRYCFTRMIPLADLPANQISSNFSKQVNIFLTVFDKHQVNKLRIDICKHVFLLKILHCETSSKLSKAKLSSIDKKLFKSATIEMAFCPCYSIVKSNTVIIYKADNGVLCYRVL